MSPDTHDQDLPLPCVHRGRAVRSVLCELCGDDPGKDVPVFACARHGECTLRRYKAGRRHGVATCLTCEDRREPAPGQPPPTARKLILKSWLSPGDILTMTAAVESLHATYPGQYTTDVRTPVPAIWEHNPHITPIADGRGELLDLGYPTINRSNQVSATFLAGYTEDLGRKLGVPLALTTNRPHLYLSDEEKTWLNQVRETWAQPLAGRDLPFWLVSAGVKSDYPAKQWPVEYYQQVIDMTRGRIQWVQVGDKEHDHPELRGVLDLRGKTDHRQLIRLAYHARGGLGPVTYLQHLMAAFEKPYLCLVGGREPLPWVASYPLQHTFHTIGVLQCCAKGACWRSRVVPAGDDDPKDRSLCERPVLGGIRPVAQCMALIRPEAVLEVLRRMETG